MIDSRDRAAWLEARRGLLTASDVAAMLGESPYKTREHLRLEKAGMADEFAGNEGMDLALALEPWVIEQANKRFGWELAPFGILIRDAACSLLGATPDAVGASPWGFFVAQVKVTSSQPTDACKPLKSGKPSTAAFAAGAPLHMQLQVQAELACTGYQHGVLLVLHTGPLCLRAYWVPRHEGAIARIRAEVPKFWSEAQALKEGRAA